MLNFQLPICVHYANCFSIFLMVIFNRVNILICFLLLLRSGHPVPGGRVPPSWKRRRTARRPASRGLVGYSNRGTPPQASAFVQPQPCCLARRAQGGALIPRAYSPAQALCASPSAIFARVAKCTLATGSCSGSNPCARLFLSADARPDPLRAEASGRRSFELH